MYKYVFNYKFSKIQIHETEIIGINNILFNKVNKMLEISIINLNHLFFLFF